MGTARRGRNYWRKILCTEIHVLELAMSDIIAERSGNILRIQLNRPDKKNAMTSSMYITMAEFLEAAAKADHELVALWPAAGPSFTPCPDPVNSTTNPRPHS